VDKNGNKMSKSRGNVVAPQSVMNNLGADVLRLWVASTDYRGEMSVSDEILKRTSDGYRRLRNTARFLLSNLNGFDPAQHEVNSDDMLALDRWVVDRAAQLQKEVTELYENYQFNQIYQKILNFCTIDLGGFYLDIIKDRQYTTQENSIARRSAQTAMYHVAEAMSRWLAPIICYTADEIWGFLPGERRESVFMETWYQDLFELNENDFLSQQDWQVIIAVRDAVSKEVEVLRNKGDIGASLSAEVELYCNDSLSETLNKLADELHFVFITSNAAVINQQFCPETALETSVEGLKLKIFASEHQKCVRCWHHREDVGSNPEHPELCGRCAENVDVIINGSGEGEARHYA